MRVKLKVKAGLTAVTILACIAYTTSALYAQPADASRERVRHKKEEMAKKFAEKLNLTPEQQKQMKKLRTEFRAQKEQLRQTLKTRRQALRDELEKPAPDQNATNAIASDIKASQGKLIDLRIKNVLKVKEVLTPEQAQQMQAMKAQHQEKKGERKKHWFKERFERFKGASEDDF
ncbi:Spy/CpxP family protein refolding chaperone [Candidatus Omnitrophota bacterium]